MKKRLFPFVILLFFLLTLTSCEMLSNRGSNPNAGDGSLSVHFLDVGQADAALLICNDEAMLIDGGNVADSSLVAAYLQEQSIQHLNYVVATHAHEDHVGGLSGALNVCSVDQVFAPVTEHSSKAFGDVIKYTKAQGKTITVPSPGDHFTLGSADVEMLGPLAGEHDENNRSIILKVTHGKNSFLFTGDAERESENELLNAGTTLGATVLKVGHHGSDTSTSYRFLREVQPAYAVISVGTGNSYGHPDETVLSRLRDADVTLYRTDLQGHIVFTSDQDGLHISTEKTSTSPTNPTKPNAIPDHYIGNNRSHKVHVPTCPNLPAEQNRIPFDTLEEALQTGYTTCGTCIK